MTTFASMFTGGGGADYGAARAGFDHLWGVEYSADIASVAWLNGYPTIIANVCDVDYNDLSRPEWLHASPPCINASVANANAGETDVDMALAEAVCRAIVALKPDYFSLENVRGYVNFKAYQAIKECLLANGYTYNDGILNAADYGTPQTRVRLFLVASRVSTPKIPLPTHYDARSGAMNMLLKPWVGWYEAIADLIDDLLETNFAPWQLKLLPENLEGFYMIDGQTGSYGTAMTIRDQAEPMYTIAASHEKRPARAYVGRVVKLSPRCLARFNGLGDDYKLPTKQSLACKVLGNMVMPGVMAAIISANYHSTAAGSVL